MEGQAFTTGVSWSTATAVDSVHAADLTFSYTIENVGTEYAREIEGVIINVYLGDDETPIVSYPAWEQFSDGKLSNLFPSASHTFTTDPIPLSLDEMRRIDLGDKLMVVLEDFNYGADELFYQDAVNGGVTFFIEDGVDDGDETVDSYVIPTWGTHNVQRVLTRYFPHTEDVNGNLLSLKTPEFDGTGAPVFNEYTLSETAWWNLYQTCVSDCTTAGATPLHEQVAEPGSAVLIRFNRDTDRDGYKDSVELRYGTDKRDPADHPQPEMLAGYVSSRDGDIVTVLLKLANTGTFDAYGIDAVMVAADDTVSIGNNTVGGNGRVRPDSQVAVGSLILPPQLDDWQGTAGLYAIGNYTGDADKTYTFTVDTAGVVGQGGTTLNWSDGAASGTLALGSSYGAPLPVAVADGLEVGFDTGTMLNGDSFTVAALTPRDTFTYTVNSEPHTPPIIVVSYSDPQGSRKFVTPVQLAALDADLTAYGGTMLPDIGLQIVTQGELATTGTNTIDFILNNPQPQSLTDAKLYLNFVSDGELVQEVPITLTVPTGPTVQSVAWSLDDFDTAYNPDGDNILLAFWTDYEGNIIDSAARPFDTFQDDPTGQLALASSLTSPRSRTADLVWDFGTVTQGDQVRETVTLGNIGHAPLRVYVDGIDGLTVDGLGLDAVGASDTRIVGLTLDTSNLTTGTFTGTATLRTSDREQSIQTIAVSGIIDAPIEAAVARPVPNHPLDVSLWIPGNHSAGEWIQFTHPLGPGTQTIHPVYVHGVDGGLLGIGEYATNFGEGTASANMFGDGRDGDLIVISGTQMINQERTSLSGSASAGQTSINVNSGSYFEPSDAILIHQSRGNPSGSAASGLWEFRYVVSKSNNTLMLDMGLENSYVDSGDSEVQVLRVPQYRNVTVNGGATLTASAWDGNTGGLVVFFVSGKLHLDGFLNASGIGYHGGQIRSNCGYDCDGYQGEGVSGTGLISRSSNSNGGGGGNESPNTSTSGGGGGGNFSAGTQAPTAPGNNSGGNGGVSISYLYTNTLVFGGGGGSGGGITARSGGRGGGIAIVHSKHLVSVENSIMANGANGSVDNQYPYNWAGGGGGAGGSIYLRLGQNQLSDRSVSAIGGNGSTGANNDNLRGGNGGVGRIRIEHCEPLTGSTNPTANTQKLDCYITEQASDFSQTRLNLPEATSGGTLFNIQYGQLVEFGTPGEVTTTLRVRDAAFDVATLDALVSGHGSNFNLKLDIGNDGSWDWQPSGDGQAQTKPSPNLAAAFNAYRQSQQSRSSDEYIDVPVRVSLDQAGQVLLVNVAVERIQAAELELTTLNAPSTAAAGSTVQLTANVTNSSNETVVGATVSFVTTLEDGQDWFLGSAFIDEIGANSSTQAMISWNTTGFTGTLPIRAYVDPYDHFVESNEDDNEATTTIEIDDSGIPTVATMSQSDVQHRISIVTLLFVSTTLLLVTSLVRKRRRNTTKV